MASLARAGGLRPTRPRGRPQAAQPARRINPFEIHKYVHGRVEEVPDPIEFVVSDKFLDRPNLYPRQATILKVMFLRDDMFTQFDYDVIGEWEEQFQQTGNQGISPGILDRIRINKERGRSWFRETEAVIGRRGGKGYIGGLSGSYVTWNYMQRPGGPQAYYGIDRDKRLTMIVFAGKKEQARDNLWRDCFNVMVGAPCFAPYISRPQAERLTIFAPSDIIRAERMETLGVHSDNDMASFEIIPAPSTVMAARGPASFSLMFDEQAHVVSSSAAAEAGAVYDASTPSLDQFGPDGFIYAPSSPWQKTGKFYENWELAIEMESGPHGEKVPAYPERMMIQLPSWGPYEDWEEAARIPIRPPSKTVIEIDVEVKKRKVVQGKRVMVTEIETREVERLVPGPTLKPLKGAVQSYDDQMRSLERANPDTFAVERRSHWAQSLTAYLAEKKVEEMFSPWNGQTLHIQRSGTLDNLYVAHGDPANTNKRFGWSLGHRVWVPDPDPEKARRGEGLFHVVFDNIRCWEPADYPDHILDYDDVMGDIEHDVKAFVPEDVSFDQFNVPATIGRLKKFVAQQDLPKQVTVREVSRTANLNWRHAELFKAALNMGLIHAPMLKLDGEVNYASSEAELELRFLEEKNGRVDHPSSGPVQTKDIADTIMEVVVTLIGRQMATFLGMQFEEVGLSGSAGDGLNPYRNTTQTNQVGQKLSEAMGGRGLANAGAARSRGRGMRKR